MSDNQFLPGVRGLGAHTQSGMIHSILSPCYDFNLLIILVLKIKLIMLYQRNLLSIVLFCIFVSVVHTPVV